VGTPGESTYPQTIQQADSGNGCTELGPNLRAVLREHWLDCPASVLPDGLPQTVVRNLEVDLKVGSLPTDGREARALVRRRTRDRNPGIPRSIYTGELLDRIVVCLVIHLLVIVPGDGSELGEAGGLNSLEGQITVVPETTTGVVTAFDNVVVGIKSIYSSLVLS
jgi:hypothetical protein